MTAAERLLIALAADAGTPELGELAATLPPGTDTARQLAAARSIRDTIDHLRAREQSLTQLLSSARDLSGIDAVDTVLRSIVARSRRLLMTDVAYFLRFDPETEGATMVVSEGIMSDAFARLSVRPREGISGFIANSRTPSWTPDYLNDPLYQHSGTIDAATTEEGIRAILGVPVLFSGRVVGVLLAADRRVHDFRPEDVDLLFSLAQHAGILIDNATVLEQGRAEVERLEASLRSHRESENGTNTLLAFQDRLLSLLMSGGTTQELARLTQEVLGGRILITDRSGVPLAAAPHTGETPTESRDRESVTLLGEDDAPLGWLSHLPEQGSVQRHSLPGTDLELLDQILTRAATVAGLLLSRHQASRNGARERASDYIQALLHDPADPNLELLRAGISANVEALSTVLVARVEDAAVPGPLIRAAQDTAEHRGGLAAAVEDGALLWLPGTDLTGTATDLAATLSDSLGTPVTVGVAALSGSPTGLRGSVRAAQDTARALIALGRSGDGATRAEIAPFPSILARSTAEELAEFVGDVLGNIENYDREHGTELLDTLATVYEHGGNVSTAAAALYLHANTVHQRLNRTDQLTAESWRDSDVTMRRQLALRVRALAAAPRNRQQPRKGVHHDRTQS